MLIKRKHLRESMQIPSPYGVGVHRNFSLAPASKIVFDMRPNDYNAWMLRREQEEADRDQPSYMIGNLDRLEQDIIGIFKGIMKVKYTIDQYTDFPQLSKSQLKAIKEINRQLDQVGTIISGEVLSNLDKLGTADLRKPGEIEDEEIE